MYNIVTVTLRMIMEANVRMVWYMTVSPLEAIENWFQSDLLSGYDCLMGS